MSHTIDIASIYEGYMGTGSAMAEVFSSIESACRSRAPVLVRGESGTGKELVARAIARGTGRSGPYVVVNCCAISEGLIESELFGHARGAFSGATGDREGLFETADEGSLFLDEIGDIPPSAQARLLRAIQDGEIRRVGENRNRRVHVRVIAATNRDLEQAMETGHFRADLFYRLNVHAVVIPPLRYHKEDIPGLARFFLEKHARAGTPTRELTPEALGILMAHDWPGNVRELENVLLRVLAVSTSTERIQATEIRACLNPSCTLTPSAQLPLAQMDYSAFRRAIEDLERDFVLEQLRLAGGQVALAAERTGIKRTALHNRIKALGIDLRALRG